jgi:hypothetical protein
MPSKCSGKNNRIAQPMVKFAQIYGCHELFLKYSAILNIKIMY